MKTFRMVLAAACVAATTAFVAVPAASAKEYNFRIGAGHPPGAIWIATLRDFFMKEVAARVQKATGDTVTWTEAWGGSVCKLGECLEAVESGLLDFADIETAFEPSKLMAHNFTYFVPFSSGDPVVVQRAAAEIYETVPQLREILAKRYNQVYLGAGVVADYGLLTNFNWSKVDDLKGQKIAAAGPNMPWLANTGIVGVQSTLNDGYTSMQTGVYNGWVMFPDAIISFKLHEISKQFVDMRFGAVHTPLLTMNKATFDGLPPAIQKIVQEVGKEWGAYSAQAIAKRHKEALADLAGKIKVVTPEEATRKAWAAALPNIPKQRFGEINKANQPGDVVYKYIEALKKAGHVFPRDWAAEK